MLFIQRHAGLDLSSRSKGRNIVCAMASVTDNNVCIILKKTHFVFREIEKPGGLLCFLDTHFECLSLAVRASRWCHYGVVVFSQRPRCRAGRPLRQPREGLSAFFTRCCYEYVSVTCWLSVCPVLTEKWCFSGCWRENAILWWARKCFVKII